MKKIIIIGISIGVIFMLSRFVYEHRGYILYIWSQIFDPKTAHLEQYLSEILKEDPEHVFNVFESEVMSQVQNQNICHGIAHKLGHESFELYGFTRSMEISRSFCGGGFIHGVIEARFGVLHEYELIDLLKTICAKDSQSCNHGIGHGLMILTKMKVDQSLMHCDVLDLEARSDCYDGVFMHLFDNEETGVYKAVPSVQEALDLCKSKSKIYQVSCAFYAPRIHAHTASSSFDAADMCKRMPLELQPACIVGAGTMFGKYVYSDEQKQKIMCEDFSQFKNGISQCLEGAKNYREKTFR